MSCRKDKPKSKRNPYNVGMWLPSDEETLRKWVNRQLKKLKERRVEEELLPSVKEFEKLIETDPEVNMFFYEMFRKPEPKAKLRNYKDMLQLISDIMKRAPEYNSTDLVGFPINAVFNDTMYTPWGFAAFLNDKVNFQLKNMLNQWGVFLKSLDSTHVLHDGDDGWFCEAALEDMGGNFTGDFICDPCAPHYGFKSWDDFFTRRFRENVRPIESPNDKNVITNACESAPYSLQKNVQLQSTFWVKGQEYSLQYMLDNHESASDFVGGTIYQAFLSATSYHRWHSPVDGTILRTLNVDGSYYSGILNLEDEAGPNKSQGYITHVAARGLVYIKADNPAIGHMWFVAVGMSEVSTCEITVYEGQHVTKGQEIGMFHFGGSTHCLVFRPDVKLEFLDQIENDAGLDATNINLNTRIATVL